MTCECGRPLIAGQDLCWKCSGDSPIPPWWRPTVLTGRYRGYYVDLGSDTIHVYVLDNFIRHASDETSPYVFSWTDWIARSD